MIYLDNAATTKPCPAAVEAMNEALTEVWGNPSAVHGLGLRAEETVKRARDQVAQALGADTLVYLTDVDGFYRDVNDEDSLIATMTSEEAHELLSSGTLATGMIPKIRSIVEALDAGVKDVRILNGTFPHSLLLEIFTDAGIGTMFTQGDDQ